MDAAIWPDSLLVSEWFFKLQQNKETDQNKMLRLDENEKNGPGAVVAAQVTSVCLDPFQSLIWVMSAMREYYVTTLVMIQLLARPII